MTSNSTVASSESSVSLLSILAYTPLRDIVRGRLTGRLDLRREIAEAGLPAPVGDLVLRVARRTRLWRLEKAEVARELCAHFADGVDAGTDPMTLVGAFGEVRTAARLIRRAKKRTRPIAWRAARRTAQALGLAFGLFLVAYLYLAGRFYLSEPTITVNYGDQINVVARAVPEADRAWPVYRAALLQLGDLPYRPSEDDPYNDQDLTDWQFYTPYLLEHTDALALARAGATKSGLGFIAGHRIEPEDAALWPGLPVAGTADPTSNFEGSLIGILLPHLSELRKLSKLLAWDARRAASAGEGELAVMNLRAILSISRQMRESPVLISDLVSVAVADLMLRTTNDVLVDHPQVFGEDQLQELAHLIGAHGHERLVVRLAAERLMFRDIMQRVYTDDGKGDGVLTADGARMLEMIMSIGESPGEQWAAALAGPLLSGVILDRREMLYEYDRLMDLFEAEAAVPMWERRGSRVDPVLECRMASPIQRIRYLPLVALMPALGRASQSAERVRAYRDALLAGIALELHHRRHGQWPESLDALVPMILPEIPVDPFTGTPMTYRLIDGQPVVYSVGNDRDDDGGAPPITRTGLRQYDAAAIWIPADVVAALKAAGDDQADFDVPARFRRSSLADGDWILWPRPDLTAY